MQDTAISPEQIKAFLQKYAEDAKNLAVMRERLSALEVKSGSARTSSLSATPKSPGNPVDILGRQVAALDTLRDAVAAAEAQVFRRRQRTETIIDILRTQRVAKWPEKCNLLSLKYIDCMGWSDVTEILFGDNPRYWDATDTFTRKTFALHRQALQELSELATADMLDDYEITESGR